MNLREACQRVLALAAGIALWLQAGLLPADSVKLNGGGALNGSVTTSAKSIAVRTPSGAVIVFDRGDVMQVTHGKASVSMTASKSANSTTKSQPKKRKLTAKEDAWMSKVRQLVGRLYAADREKSRRAQTELLNIDDADALPALSTYLGSSRSAEGRRLYVVILHNIKGPKPVYYLVALSLFDPFPEIRDEARKALRDDQLDPARLLYITALRSGAPRLARLAAVALGEIGDPRGESVPYLIDALVTYGTVAAMRAPANADVLYMNMISAVPGLNLNDVAVMLMGSFQRGQSPPPEFSATQGNPNSCDPQQRGANSPNSQGTPSALAAQVPGSTSQSNLGTSGTTLTEDELYEPPHSKCKKKHDSPLQGYVDHPEVLDALLKITDQPHPGYGFNQDRWRSWWMNEKTDRNLQKPAARDRVVAGGGTAH
jgi:hypothetical protein